RIDELEKTLASMRKSLGEYNPGQSSTATTHPTETTGFGSNFGHPLDILARTAADTNSPNLDRLNSSFNGITPCAAQYIRRQQPILFLSVIAAAASTLADTDMFEKLQNEAISIITYNAVVEGQKTSELLLSLLILTFWPMAPPR